MIYIIKYGSLFVHRRIKADYVALGIAKRHDCTWYIKHVHMKQEQFSLNCSISRKKVV